MRKLNNELYARAVDPSGRRWFYVPYDQLTASLGPLAKADPRETGIVLIEAPAKAARRPYHQQKLAMVLANQRHFAIEQAQRGIAIRYLVAPNDYADTLAIVARELGPLHMMEAAERELRVELAGLVERGTLVVHPHEGWLTTRDDFVRGAGTHAPWRMDAFYRFVRVRIGILMDRGKPLGGKLSHDAENRKAWRGRPAAPQPPTFAPDAITEEVGDLIATHFAKHPGTLDLTTLPASAADAETVWRWAKTKCLPMFGPFEDAMSTQSSGLFHTRISPLVNLHRLLPTRVVNEIATDETIPLSSREGFVRQMIGWREFVRHVHVETDGFRILPNGPPAIAEAPRQRAYSAWRGEPWPTPVDSREATRGGAAPSELEAHEPLPPAYWGTKSGLACLDHVVEGVWREGWSHHITRLMVLSNLATLLGYEPRELRLVLGRVYRRVRLGRRAQRARHGYLRRRRAHDDEALYLRCSLHSSHE